MSEHELCPSNQPPPSPSPHLSTVLYIQGSGVPQRFIQGTYNDISETGGVMENFVKPGVPALNYITSYPSTASSTSSYKYPEQIVCCETSKKFKGIHEDSYTTEYTSDESDVDSRNCQRFPKPRGRRKLGTKSFPQSFDRRVERGAGRPLFGDKITTNSHVPSMKNSFSHRVKQEENPETLNESMARPTWEAKTMQLAERERQLDQAEEAVKQQEEKAQECLRLALHQQEIALNQREADLRAREAAVQKKLEQATKLFEESRKIVCSEKMKSEGYACDSSSSFALPRRISSSFYENSMNSDKTFESKVRTPEVSYVENKGVLKRLSQGYRCRSISESGLSMSVGRKREPGPSVASFSRLPKTAEVVSNLVSVSLPNDEVHPLPRPYSVSRSMSSSSCVEDDKRRLIRLSKDNSDTSPIVKTYLRSGRYHTTNDNLSSSPVLFKTGSVTTTPSNCTLHDKISPHNCSTPSAVASCSEETIMNGEVSVTITPLAAKSESFHSSNVIPKLESSKDCQVRPPANFSLPPSSSEGLTRLKPGRMSNLVACDSRTKSTLTYDNCMVSPPKIICAKPIPPIDKSSSHMQSSECKSDLVYQSQSAVSSRNVGNYNNRIDSKGMYPAACISSASSLPEKRSVYLPSAVSVHGYDVNGFEEGVGQKRIQEICHETLEDELIESARNPSTAASDSDKFRMWNCNVKDLTSPIHTNSTGPLQDEVVMFSNNATESVKYLPDITSRQVDVLQPENEKSTPSYIKAEDGQYLHGGPFLPGDILYIPGNKLIRLPTSSSVGNYAPSSSNGRHSPQDSRQMHSFQNSLSEFNPKLPSQSETKHLPREPMSLDGIIPHSGTPQLTSLTEQSAKAPNQFVIPSSVDVAHGRHSVPFMQGRKLTHVSSCRGASPALTRSVSLMTQSLQTTSASPITVDSNISDSSQDSCTISNQVMPYPNSVSTSQVMSDCNVPSSLSFITSSQGSCNSANASPSLTNTSEEHHKSGLKHFSQSSPFNLANSQRNSTVLMTSTNTCGTELSSCVGQSVSQDIQLNQELPMPDQMKAPTQEIEVPQEFLKSQEPISGCVKEIEVSQEFLESQEPESDCVSQWEPKIISPCVSETLANLGDYDPVSQTLTTSNPVFLQSILSNSISLSSGFVDNSQAEAIYSSDTVQSKGDLLQPDVLENEGPKRDLNLPSGYNVDQTLTEDQTFASVEDVVSDEKAEIDDPKQSGATISIMEQNDPVESKYMDADVTVSNNKFCNDTPDSNGNDSDCGSKVPRTDNIFACAGISSTQGLSKTVTSTSAMQDEYLNIDDTNLNENCFSDSDDGCAVEANLENTYSDVNEVIVMDESSLKVDACSESRENVEADSSFNHRQLEQIYNENKYTYCKSTSELTTESSNSHYDNEDRTLQANLIDNEKESVDAINELPKLLDLSPCKSEICAPIVEDNVDHAQGIPSSLDENHLTRTDGVGIALSESNLNELCEGTNLEPRKHNPRKRKGRGWSKKRNKKKKSVLELDSGCLLGSGEVVPSDSCIDVNLPSVDEDAKEFSEDKRSSEIEMESKSSVISADDVKTQKHSITRKRHSAGDDDMYEAEPEKFEHVSHSGRKVKLRSFLKGVVGRGKSQKKASPVDFSVRDKSSVPGSRKTRKTNDVKGKKFVDCKEKGKKKKKASKKSNEFSCISWRRDNSLVEVKCGKCDHVSESKANFVSHVEHEHNGLARPQEESQEFSEDQKRIALQQTLKLVKILKCELCSKILKSYLGFKHHEKVCGYTQEERRIECTVCGKMVLQLLHHMREMHKIYQRKHRNNISGSHKSDKNPPSESPHSDAPRPKRQAATNCSVKLKGWHSEECGTGEGSNAPAVDCDEDTRKHYKREAIQVPYDVQSKWEAEIGENGKACCLHADCNYTFENLSDGCKHYTNCKLLDVKKKYKCKICSLSLQSENEIKEHVLNKHSQFEPPDNSENYMSDDDADFEQKKVVKPSVPKQHSVRYSNSESFKPKSLGDFFRPLELALQWTEEFNQENFSRHLFQNFSFSYEDWLLLTVEDTERFAPPVAVSPKFKISSVSKIAEDNKSTDWQLLNRFHGTSLHEGFALFLGGPAVVSAWCPQPFQESSSEMPQYLAIYASSLPDKTYSPTKSYCHEGVIQIWQCFCLRGTNICVPEFQFGIALDFGNVWSLAWCPSGTYEEGDNEGENLGGDETNMKRLGLLAAGCSDGTVRIFVIPSPKAFDLQGTSRLFKVKPKVTLRLSSSLESNQQCLQIDWFRGKGHAYIAGAFSAGLIGIWDLNMTSPLLYCKNSEGIVIYPVKSFLAHNGACSAVAFCPTTGGRNLMSGGNDRTFKFWDLENTDMPLNVCRKGLVTSSIWFSHWPGSFVSFDDVFSFGNTHTCYKENGFYRIHPRNVMGANSPVWSIGGSEWFNSVMQGDASGQVIITVQQQLIKNYEHDKVAHKRKIPLLGVHLELLAEAKLLSFRTKQAVDATENKNQKSNPPAQSEQECEKEGNGPSTMAHLALPQNKKVTNKNQKSKEECEKEENGPSTMAHLALPQNKKVTNKNQKSNPPAQSKEECEKEGNGPSTMVHLALPQTYSEMCDSYGVVFREQDCRSFLNIPEAEFLGIKYSENIEPGPLACYPLMSVTSVSWNNNFKSRSWVFIGTQSGLGRIVSIEALENCKRSGVRREMAKNYRNVNHVKPNR